ncbi:hypothetical protein ACC806_03620 [Rhizobium ruizarguesonis]
MPVRLQAAPAYYSETFLSGRRRSWLHSAYEDDIWIVEDSAGEKRQYTISFVARMADGRMLSDHPDLLATAKEIVFWIRAGNYTRLDDGARHAQYGATVVRLCYGLTARGFSSFADLSTLDIETICADAAFGVDGLVGASKILREYFGRFTTWDEVPDDLAKEKEFNLATVIEKLNLPERWAQKEIKSEVVVATAKLNGKLLASVAQSKVKPISIQNIQIVTMLFDGLYALRHFMEAPTIRFRPFPEGPGAKATELGSATDRTPIAHPDLVLKFLEEAMRYVATNSATILGEYQAILSDRKSIELDSKAIEGIRAEIYTLTTACYVLIAAFSARRAFEIKELYWDCIKGDEENGWWMNVYIAKTERQRTWIPVPGIVARSVEVLRSLNNEPAVGEPGKLFTWLDPMLDRLVELKPQLDINDFAKLVGAHEHTNDNGVTEPWHWTTRQFRRFYAVLFFYRYRGKKEVLAHHLRHFNVQMTDDYIALDPEQTKIWVREVYNYKVQLANDIVSGRTVYTGPMGEQLNKQKVKFAEIFSKTVRVVTEATARTILRTTTKRHLIFTPKPWVTCTCPYNTNGAEKAACRKLAGNTAGELGPDFAAAGPTVCPGCPWALIGPENIAYMDRELEDMRSSFVLEDEPSIFGELQAANVFKLESYRKTLRVD